KLSQSSAKGTFLKKVSISTTMGAGVAVDQASLNTQA
ncbi:50S ribosomal protein L1, partial [Vibrio parahaemolyticus]|nr:50S ribosomal protein L1 [Vibrio parahaemolyticus]